MGKLFKYVILIFLISILIGYCIGKFYPIINSKQKGELNKNVAGSEKSLENLETANKSKIIETANLDEKLLPTATLVLEKKYGDCKHTVKKESELPSEMANLTKEEIANAYKDWTIKEFSKDKLCLYKIVKGLCDEHFVINSNDGVVTVYRLDENYDRSLYEKTNIYTEYLSKEDLEKLEEGIYVYGVSDLNSTLESFE